MTIQELSSSILTELSVLDIDERVTAINTLREAIHSVSPFKTEPVDMVTWVKSEAVQANDYNPNTVAPPEMELLKISILEDGYTQPIVSFFNEGVIEVVDGFHRNRVAKECSEVGQRLHGYLPVVNINDNRSDKGDRVASTIRHNRARGKHKIGAMSNIVLDLKRRNWTDKKIAKELGMEPDEVLRLAQITGIAELFSKREFSQSWDIPTTDADITEIDLADDEIEDAVIDG